MGRLIVSSRCRMCRCKLELSVDNGLFVQISVFAQTVQSSSGVGLLRCLERLSHGGAIFTCARVGVRVTVARDKNLHLHLTVGSGEILQQCTLVLATLQHCSAMSNIQRHMLLLLLGWRIVERSASAIPRGGLSVCLFVC